MLVNDPGSSQFFRRHIATLQHSLMVGLMASIVFGFMAVMLSLADMREGYFDRSRTVVPPAIRAVIADADVDLNLNELRRCWVPSDRSEPRDCWMVPGAPAKEQRLRIDGDGSLEDCWPHPEEAGVDVCESPQMAFVV